MRLHLVLACILVPSALLLADSIDDADAKRRGVPVAQVQAERALAAERQKTAALEKQIAGLQKQIADISNTKNIPSPAANADASKTAVITPPGSGPTAGVKEPADPYDRFVERYMSGKWDGLAAEMAAQEKSLAKLDAAKARDIAYIRKAMAEGRPDWWEMMAAGKSTLFEADIFGKILPVSFTDDSSGAIRAVPGIAGGKLLVDARWWSARIGMQQPIYFQNSDMDTPAYGHYIIDDDMDCAVWNALGVQLPMVDVGFEKANALSKNDKLHFDAHRAFCSAAVPLYYCTPQARYYYLMSAATSYMPQHLGVGSWDGRRQFASFLLIEFLTHRDKYPDLKVGPIKDLPATGEKTENSGNEIYMLRTYLYPALVASKLTFAEDCALRQAILDFEKANSDWLSNKINLQQGQVIDLDEHTNTNFFARYDWLKAQLEAKPAKPK